MIDDFYVTPWWMPIVVALITAIPGTLAALGSRRNYKKLREVNHGIRDQAQATSFLAETIKKNGLRQHRPGESPESHGIYPG